MKKIAFIFSGRGSLLKPICDNLKNVSVKSTMSLVITNNPEINQNSIELPKNCDFHCIDHKLFKNKADHEAKITNLIRKYSIDLIVLGGYRRIFSEAFVTEFGDRTINTHPSLLPSFVGDKAQLRAIERGVRITGTTVHFINNDVDQGPIILQAAANVMPHYSESDLKDAIVGLDKKVLPHAVKLFLENKLRVKNNSVKINPGYENELFDYDKY